MNLPAVMPVEGAANCLCADCLSKAIDEVLRVRAEQQPASQS